MLRPILHFFVIGALLFAAERIHTRWQLAEQPLGEIVLERTTLRLNEDEKQLFDAFETLTPGQFRRVLKVAQWRRADDPDGTLLTREAEPSNSLFYIFEGIISVEKHGRRFRLPADNFVGEVGYVLNRKTTTTSVAPRGVRYVEWDADALRKLSRKYPNLGNALNALLGGWPRGPGARPPAGSAA